MDQHLHAISPNALTSSVKQEPMDTTDDLNNSYFSENNSSDETYERLVITAPTPLTSVTSLTSPKKTTSKPKTPNIDLGQHFGMAKIIDGKQRGSILSYDSQIHEGRKYRFRGYNNRKDPDDPIKFLCIDCFLTKRDKSKLADPSITENPVPYIYVKNGYLFTDPDAPEGKHFCKGYTSKSKGSSKKRGRPRKISIDPNGSIHGPENQKVRAQEPEPDSNSDSIYNRLRRTPRKIDQLLPPNHEPSSKNQEKSPFKLESRSSTVEGGTETTQSEAGEEPKNMEVSKEEGGHDFYYKIQVTCENCDYDPEKDLGVEIENGWIIVKGTHEETSTPQEKVLRKFEFKRRLPETINVDSIKCDYNENGFLIVTGKKKADKLILPIHYKK